MIESKTTYHEIDPLSTSPRMILYARISTDRSKQEDSLEKQVERMHAACKLHSLTPVVIFEEEASAKNIKGRPKFRLAIEMLQRGEADGLMVTDLSRLTRDVGDFSELCRTVFKGHRLHIIQEMIDTKTPFGRYIGTILTAGNQLFREMVGEKTKKAMVKLRSENKKSSSKPPFGWAFTNGSELREVQAEQLCLGRIMSLYQDGYTPHEISNVLSDEGFKTAGQRNGTNPQAAWTGTTVKRIVERELERRKKVTK